MPLKGKITTWHDDKGFGFVEPCTGGKPVFLHINAFRRRGRRPAVGQLVTFTLSKDKQGRPCAVQATLAGERLVKKETPKREAKKGALSIPLALLFLLGVAGAVLAAKLPPAVFGLYAVASLITFAVYAWDKSAARRGAWRTQESTLHLLALLGGWPGALVAQQTLRHKSQKPSFRLVCWLTVLLNGGAFLWLFTPEGQARLQALGAALL